MDISDTHTTVGGWHSWLTSSDHTILSCWHGFVGYLLVLACYRNDFPLLYVQSTCFHPKPSCVWFPNFFPPGSLLKEMTLSHSILRGWPGIHLQAPLVGKASSHFIALLYIHTYVCMCVYIYIYVYIQYSYISKICLFENQSYTGGRKGERKRGQKREGDWGLSSIYWVTPQMARPKPGSSSALPTLVAEAQVLGPSSAVFPGTLH